MPILFANTDEEFTSLRSKLKNIEAGGQVSFLGKVRRFDQGKEVSFLNYEAHVDMASSLFLKLEEEARARFSILECQALHRLGRVELGQGAVFIEVSAKHRHEAFMAARFLIDELKHELPIWKKQVFIDQSSSWPKCEHEKAHALPVEKALLARGLDKSKKRVLLVGAGGLGCPLAVNLSSLCSLTIFDGDVVEARNLARQFVYSQNDVGQSKAFLLKKFLRERGAEVLAHERFLTKNEAEELASSFDLIIDGSDCPLTKKMLKKVAFLKSVPLILASVYRSEGEVQIFIPKTGACLSCFDSAVNHEQACSDAGVFTHTCAMVAAIAADKAMMALSGKISSSEMLIVDMCAPIKSLKIGKDEHCQVCASQKLVRFS